MNSSVQFDMRSTMSLYGQLDRLLLHLDFVRNQEAPKWVLYQHIDSEQK